MLFQYLGDEKEKGLIFMILNLDGRLVLILNTCTNTLDDFMLRYQLLKRKMLSHSWKAAISNTEIKKKEGRYRILRILSIIS